MHPPPAKRAKIVVSPWTLLSPELLVHIGSFLDPTDLLNARASCSVWCKTFTLFECFRNATVSERTDHLLSIVDSNTCLQARKLLRITHLDVAECIAEWSRHLSQTDSGVYLAVLQTIPLHRMRMQHKMALLLQMVEDESSMDILHQVMGFTGVRPSDLMFQPEELKISVSGIVDKFLSVYPEDNCNIENKVGLLSKLGVGKDFIRKYNNNLLVDATDYNNLSVVVHLHKGFGLDVEDARMMESLPIFIAVTRGSRELVDCLVKFYGINGLDILESFTKRGDLSQFFWFNRTEVVGYMKSMFPEIVSSLKKINCVY